jgi:hypothetical protein
LAGLLESCHELIRLGIRRRDQIDVCRKQSINTYQYLCIWSGRGRLYLGANGDLRPNFASRE